MSLALRVLGPLLMPRKKLFAEGLRPIHVSSRTEDQQMYALPILKLWEIFSSLLYRMTLTYGIRIHAFVLMGNHFHLLVSDPQKKFEKAMLYLFCELNASIGSPKFESEHHASVIHSRKQFEIIYKYVYRNPVEAGLCKVVEKYPFTTLTRVLGYKKMEFPVFDNTSLIQNPYQKLKWLNTPYPDEFSFHELELALRENENL